MTVAEMHTAVKILVDKLDTLNYADLRDVEIDFFLNRAMTRFIKERYKEYEENQKRMDDLRNITVTTDLTPAIPTTSNKEGGWFVTLPSASNDTYWLAVTEEAILNKKKCGSKEVTSGNIASGVTYIVLGDNFTDEVTYNGTAYTHGQLFTGVTTTTGDVTDFTVTSGTNVKVYQGEISKSEIKPMRHDDYNKTKNDPFNKPVIGEVNQLRRLQLAGQMEILAPTDVYLTNYILRYIRKPQQISLALSTDCELADHTHEEIVDMTVSSILETIESGRYQTNLNELNKLE